MAKYSEGQADIPATSMRVRTMDRETCRYRALRYSTSSLAPRKSTHFAMGRNGRSRGCLGLTPLWTSKHSAWNSFYLQDPSWYRLIGDKHPIWGRMEELIVQGFAQSCWFEPLLIGQPEQRFGSKRRSSDVWIFWNWRGNRGATLVESTIGQGVGHVQNF